MKSADTSHSPAIRRPLFLLGPGAVGKGFLVSHLPQGFANIGEPIHVIGTGQLTRDRMATDALFREKWGSRVGAGELLDDDVVSELFSSAIRNFAPDKVNIIIDGHLRTVAQAKEMHQFGWLNGNSRIIILNASEHTCLTRFTSGAKSYRRDRSDNDIAAFKKKFADFNNTIGDLRAFFRKIGQKPIEINANRPLDSVLKAVHFHASQLWQPDVTDEPWKHSRNHLAQNAPSASARSIPNAEEPPAAPAHVVHSWMAPHGQVLSAR